MWDSTWDEITNKKYLQVPYNKWNEGDIFSIRHDMIKEGAVSKEAVPFVLQPPAEILVP